VYVKVVVITEAEVEELLEKIDTLVESLTDIQGMAGAANPVSSPRD